MELQLVTLSDLDPSVVSAASADASEHQGGALSRGEELRRKTAALLKPSRERGSDISSSSSVSPSSANESVASRAVPSNIGASTSAASSSSTAATAAAGGKARAPVAQLKRAATVADGASLVFAGNTEARKRTRTDEGNPNKGLVRTATVAAVGKAGPGPAAEMQPQRQGPRAPAAASTSKGAAATASVPAPVPAKPARPKNEPIGRAPRKFESGGCLREFTFNCCDWHVFSSRAEEDTYEALLRLHYPDRKFYGDKR